ncbi:MAG: flap structure-specific endonuclease [Candidatus Micrarchaeota archaeon]|nr:flap structure-specific endonuclease [Candidatus Micrarchaeota archaeon]MCX8154343.1 flap structure-specific endonuclease [Candidatus Micrarchaeota archaeon]
MGSDLKRLVEPVTKTIHISKLSGRTIAIDGNNMAYSFLAAIRSRDGDYLRDRDGNITSHLSGTFYRLSNFLINKIRVIVVFDGSPPHFKRAEIERRIAVRSTTEYRDMVFDQNMKHEMRELLEAMGIASVDAPSEGEAQASYLTQTGIAYALNSQDYDSFLFGAKRVLRNFYGEDRFEIVDIDSLLEYLGIDRERLVLLGMLIGTDFNRGIHGIGPVKGLEIIKKESKDNILKRISQENGVDAQEIFDFFMKPPIQEISTIQPKQLQPDRIIEILVHRHQFSEDRVKNILQELIRVSRERTVFDV